MSGSAGPSGPDVSSWKRICFSLTPLGRDWIQADGCWQCRISIMPPWKVRKLWLILFADWSNASQWCERHSCTGNYRKASTWSKWGHPPFLVHTHTQAFAWLPTTKEVSGWTEEDLALQVQFQGITRLQHTRNPMEAQSSSTCKYQCEQQQTPFHLTRAKHRGSATPVRVRSTS